MTLVHSETDMRALQALGAQIVARDRWSRAQILDLQRKRLRELVAHAVARSPYYREALGAVTADEIELDRLPTLPKQTLVDEFDRIVTDPRIKLADLEEHLAAERGDPYLGKYLAFSTSGTSGLRALVVYTRDEFDHWVAASFRVFARVGITPETRLVAIGAPSLLHITRQLFVAFRSGRTGTPELTVLTSLPEMVDALNAYQPDAILGYASIAGLLAGEQLAGRLEIRPRIVGVSSEVLTDEAASSLRAAWGIEATQVYASTEVLYLASSAPPRPDLHVFDDLAVVEVVDGRGAPVPPGVPGYKVLVTNLVNRTQPLIRYEISDSVTLPDAPDSSGLPFGRVARIDGRSDDILHFERADGGDVAVHPYRLRAPFASMSEVRQYQVVQMDTGLQVRIVVQRDAPADVPARVRAEMLASLADAGAVVPGLEVVVVDTIEREPGHAAKLKLIKREQPSR